MTDPVYTLKLELAVGSLTDVTSSCTRAHYERTLFTAFNGVRPEAALFEFASSVGSFNPVVNSNVAPGRRIELTATHGGSSYALYSGRVRNIKTRIGIGENASVMEAFTDVERLDRTKVKTGLLVDIRVNSLFTEVMTRCSVNSFTSQNIGDVAHFAWYDDRVASNALGEIVQSGWYESFVDGAGTFKLRERFGQSFTSSNFSVSTITQALDINVGLTNEEVLNSFHLSGTPRAQATTVQTVGYLQGNPFYIQPGATAGFFVGFFDPRNLGEFVAVGSTVTQVQTSDWPLSDIVFMTDSGGGNPGLTIIGSASMTAFAQSAVCSFTNATNSAGWLTKFMVRGYPILAGSDITVLTENKSSQIDYGVRDASFNGLLITDQSFLKGYGVTLLAERSIPTPRLSVTLKNEFPDLLGLDLGAIAAVPPAGVSSLWSVRGISHDIDLSNGTEHTAALELEPWLGTRYAVVDGVSINPSSAAAAGTTLTTSGATGGFANSTKGIYSLWFRIQSNDSLWRNGGGLLPAATTSLGGSNRMGMTVSVASLAPTGSFGYVSANMLGTDGITRMAAVTTSRAALSPSSLWHHAIAAWDSAAGLGKFYVDDIGDVAFTVQSGTVGVNSSTWQFGFSNKALRGITDIAELWFKGGVYVDLDAIPNRRKFLTADKQPAYLGDSGEIPGLGAPDVYMGLRDLAIASNFMVNRGSVPMVFSLTNSIGTSDTTPGL